MFNKQKEGDPAKKFPATRPFAIEQDSLSENVPQDKPEVKQERSFCDAVNDEIHVFDESKAAKKGGLGFKVRGKGNYFTAKQLDGTERYGSRVLSVYQNIRKPFVYKGGGSFLTQTVKVMGS